MKQNGEVKEGEREKEREREREREAVKQLN